MPVRAVCKPHSPDLKRGALATDARGCSLWRSLLERPPPAPKSRVRDPLSELVRTRVGGVTHTLTSVFLLCTEHCLCEFCRFKCLKWCAITMICDSLWNRLEHIGLILFITSYLKIYIYLHIVTNCVVILNGANYFKLNGTCCKNK